MLLRKPLCDPVDSAARAMTMTAASTLQTRRGMKLSCTVVVGPVGGSTIAVPKSLRMCHLLAEDQLADAKRWLQGHREGPKWTQWKRLMNLPTVSNY